MDEAIGGGMRPMGAGWGWLLAYGILSAIVGIAAFAWPFSATVAATLIVGTFFLAVGAIALAAAIFGGAHDGRVYQALFGIGSLIIGAIIAFDTGTGAVSLTLLVVIWLGARGVLEIVWGARYPRHRGLMIVLGIVNIGLAVLILATLGWSALTLPGYVLGISFLFAGVVEIARAAAHRKGAAAFAV